VRQRRKRLFAGKSAEQASFVRKIEAAVDLRTEGQLINIAGKAQWVEQIRAL
jgi:hypothetical protein